jgi:hypothetical protein
MKDGRWIVRQLLQADCISGRHQAGINEFGVSQTGERIASMDRRMAIAKIHRQRQSQLGRYPLDVVWIGDKKSARLGR